MSRVFRPIYLLTGLVAALLLGFGLLADEVVEGDTLNWDKSILLMLRVPGHPSEPIGPIWLQEAVRDITALGSFSLLTIIVLAVFVHLLLVGRSRTAWFIAVAVVSGTALSSVLKAVFDRPRPDLTGIARVFTASFPSGHATISAVVFLTLGALLAERASTARLRAYYLCVAATLAILVGLSRVYLGVHYPTDVLAGWLIGTAWALICVALARFMRERRSMRPRQIA